VYACQATNDTRDGHLWNILIEDQDTYEKPVFITRPCMHCENAPCVDVCPVHATYHRPDGLVTMDYDRCIGCRYCMVACPFHVPKYEWEKALPRVQKCIFCFEKRLREGGQPACTEVCPAKATVFGDREALIQEARGRIQAHPGRYVDHIYGLEEAGGTSALYLSSVPFERLGFPTGLDREPYPRLTWEVLSKIPNVVGVGGALMFGIWWIVNRRMELKGRDALKGGLDEGAEGDR
jgi:formate dehydrogenase iron-sulfur subunit